MKQLIAITRPEIFAEEAPLLESLFEKGLERLHIRKPQSEAKEVEKLLKAINPAYYPRIALHDHFELAEDYGLGGVHLNSRNPQAPASFKGRVSRSCHSIEELAAYPQLDYLFLSPIFPSISKAGYGKGFPIDFMKEAAQKGLITPRVVALGGISTETIPQLRDIPFGGFAVLGALWGENPHSDAPQRLHQLLKCVEDSSAA